MAPYYLGTCQSSANQAVNQNQSAVNQTVKLDYTVHWWNSLTAENQFVCVYMYEQILDYLEATNNNIHTQFNNHVIKNG